MDLCMGPLLLLLLRLTSFAKDSLIAASSSACARVASIWRRSSALEATSSSTLTSRLIQTHHGPQEPWHPR